jgi:cobalt-zinc-cadmium efflux system protein
VATTYNHHPSQASDKLALGIFLSSLILGAEIVGGLISNSLALLADAGHVLADVVALGLSWYGVRQARRAPTQRMTFGFHRVGVLVALVNAVGIFVVAAFIIFEAIRRLEEPAQVNSTVMTTVAVAGLAINIFVALRLRTESRLNINIRSAFWHASGDALASIGVIIGGLIIAFTGLNIVDPIISTVIAVIIVFAGWDIFRDGLRVLLEAVPQHLEIQSVQDSIEKISGVQEAHDVHVWSITPEIHAMSAHVLVKGEEVGHLDAIRRSIESMLGKTYEIQHTTLQMECTGCGDGEALCQLCVRLGMDQDRIKHNDRWLEKKSVEQGGNSKSKNIE